jgi:V/A-type H+-transporting ATPase subunit C
VDSIKENLLKRDFYAVFKDKAEAAEKAYNCAAQSENGQLAEIITDRAAIDYMASYGKNLKDKITAEVCTFISDTSNIRIALRCVLAGKDESFINEAIGQCVNLSRERLVETTVKGKDELYSYLYTTSYKDGATLSEKSFSDFETWCDEKLIEIATESRYTAFAFSPVCYYYYKKLTEIKKVNMVLSRLSVVSESEEGQGEANV